MTTSLTAKNLPGNVLKARTTHTQLIWEQFRRHKLAIIGLVFLVILGMVALFGKWIMPYDPNQIDMALSVGIPQPPSPEHWVGTDNLGRDLFSRLISGAQISLSVGFVAVGLSVTIGILVGSISGFAGGWVDMVLTRIVDIFLSVPSFFLMMTVNVFFEPSIYNVMVIIGMFSWMGVSRLVRGEFLRLKEMDFTMAARASGVPVLRMMWKHILPNAIAPVIVAGTIGIPYAILLESGLSFLGLGVPPPTASWGNLLFDARLWLNTCWWFWAPPGLLISLTVIAFNFVGDGLRDAFDPTQRGR
jgi:peptide/nickel transport system permease protein